MTEHDDAAATVYDLYELGRLLFESGDPAGAVAPLTRAVALAPTKASLHELLGRACLATSRAAAAQRAFAAAVDLDPSDDYAHYGLGRAYERQGRLVEAARHFKLATALSPRPTYRRAAERVARRTERRER